MTDSRSGSGWIIPATRSMRPRHLPRARPTSRGPAMPEISRQARTCTYGAWRGDDCGAAGSVITALPVARSHRRLVGGKINHGIVEVLKKEYDLGRANVVFRDIALRMPPPRCSEGGQRAVAVVPLTRNTCRREEPVSRRPEFVAGPDTDRCRRRDRRYQGPYESFDIQRAPCGRAPFQKMTLPP